MGGGYPPTNERHNPISPPAETGISTMGPKVHPNRGGDQTTEERTHMSTTPTHTPRTEKTAALWVQYPERVLTPSTGRVHVWTGRGTVCASRIVTRQPLPEGTTPTCAQCGADPVTD